MEVAILLCGLFLGSWLTILFLSEKRQSKDRELPLELRIENITSDLEKTYSLLYRRFGNCTEIECLKITTHILRTIHCK